MRPVAQFNHITALLKEKYLQTVPAGLHISHFPLLKKESWRRASLTAGFIPQYHFTHDPLNKLGYRRTNVCCLYY